MYHPSEKNSPFPLFSQIVPEAMESEIKQLIASNRQALAQLLKQETYTWDNLLLPMEEMNDQLSKRWSPVSHLHAVLGTEAWREAYKNILPILTEYHTEVLQNEQLYKAIQSIALSESYQHLSPAQRKVIDNDLRDFRLAGVHLSPQDKVRFTELQKKLSELSTTFADHILDATDGWTLHVTDRNALKGLPLQAIIQAEETAQRKEKQGFVLTLDYACYSTVMKYLDNRELRWLMYEAYVTRASDQGPKAGCWDNTPIMEEIVATRHALATLLGFPNYAVYSLQTKMAQSPEKVLAFLHDLAAKSKPTAEQEIKALADFAKNTHGIETLEAWDLAYYSEKWREAAFAVSQEDLRPYFPASNVLNGMFEVMQQLYGIHIKAVHGVEVWHPQVQFFEVTDEKEQLRGYFYTDLYARPQKREGAWMDECRVRRRQADGTLQYPIAYLTCNFSAPTANRPACLTHDDVTTLFHEFGHCLHHLLTQVNVAGVSGINGVPWDAVEFPSQFLEFWCWEKEVLQTITSHVDTGEKLPDALFNKMIAAKHFQSGMQMLRQLEFSLFDFRLHHEYDPTKGPQVQAMLDDVRRTVSVLTTPGFNRFQHSFSHIFSGGYAAGYYSYKWAEVLSSDAFEPFEEKGIFDRATGQLFLTAILEQGGVYDPMECFVTFRGREPSIQALLRHSGLVSS